MSSNTSGNSCRIEDTLPTCNPQSALATLALLALMKIVSAQFSDGSLINLCLARSMMKSFSTKKSDPNMGLFTSATLNTCSMGTPCSFSSNFLVPKVRIAVPFAANKAGEAAACGALSLASAGNTDTSAPVSIKNARPEMLSHTDRDPVCVVCMDLTCAAAVWILEKLDVLLLEIVPGASASRRGRFPRPASG